MQTISQEETSQITQNIKLVRNQKLKQIQEETNESP